MNRDSCAAACRARPLHDRRTEGAPARLGNVRSLAKRPISRSQTSRRSSARFLGILRGRRQLGVLRLTRPTRSALSQRRSPIAMDSFCICGGIGPMVPVGSAVGPGRRLRCLQDERSDHGRGWHRRLRGHHRHGGDHGHLRTSRQRPPMDAVWPITRRRSAPMSRSPAPGA